eukprot:CFRG2660T1
MTGPATRIQNVAILIFNQVEVLDFAGPFEVFSITGKLGSNNDSPFNVYTVAETSPVDARNGLSINPHYTIHNCPTPDILIVPGGGGFYADGTPFGTRREIDNKNLLAWIEKCSKTCEKVLSVCTGALLLGKIGLLDGKVATTHHLALTQLAELVPTARVQAEARIADNGSIVLAAGISAGIDMSLYVVSQLISMVEAKKTAAYMEYDWDPKQLKVVEL